MWATFKEIPSQSALYQSKNIKPVVRFESSDNKDVKCAKPLIPELRQEFMIVSIYFTST